MRILVIDDEQQTRAAIIRLLRRLGDDYNVVGEADNGYDGMLLIKELQPQVVITDIMMPRVNGLDMIENARACAPNTHFLILSGYAEFELARRAVNLPVVEYLLKPIMVEQMQTAMDALSRRLGQAVPAPLTVEPPAAEDYCPITTYIIAEIQRCYSQRLYLEELAKQLKVSPEHAGFLFSRDTGKSFSIYVRDLRMEKAKELLGSTSLKIYEIAYKTGYSDVKYFCRVFKEYTGVSAKNYLRKQLIEK